MTSSSAPTVDSPAAATSRVRAVDADPQVRLRAVEELPLGPLPHLYLLRACLLEDEHASVRAAVPSKLVEANDQRAVPWLLEALTDEAPSVREAVWRALARLDVAEGLPAASRTIHEEEVWWVRRAAVRAAAKLGREGAVPLLIDALEDPFWRSRYAAIQALAGLVEKSAVARAAVEKVRESPSENVRRAARWILSGDEALPAPASEASPGTDEDPAVTTARLEREPLPPAVLVRLLGDPHEALRRMARRRLETNADLAIARAVAAWLDEGRVPYAAETARAALDEMQVDRLEVASSILSELAVVGPGQLAWACAVAVRLGEASDVARVRPLLRDARSEVRAAAAAALAGDEGSEAEVIAALGDDRVRATVARWWLAQPTASALGLALHRASRADPLPWIATARALGLAEVLREAWSSAEGRGRAEVVAGLCELGQLDAPMREAALADEDPWVRAATLALPRADQGSDFEARREEAVALRLPIAARLALEDPDPIVCRLAATFLVRERHQLAAPERHRCAEALSRALDPELRVAAPALLLRGDVRTALPWLLRLSRDSSLAVRGSAATSLEATENLDQVLDAFLLETADHELRMSAYTWLLRRGDAGAADRLVQALAQERQAPVLEHLRTVSLVFPEELLPPSVLVVHPRARPTVSAGRTSALAAHPNVRPLGQSGVTIAPLVISGVNELAGSAFAEAVERGATSFFWERTHQSLSRFLSLRRAQPFTIIGGTYNSGSTWIRRDLEGHLKALGRDSLDVFLLFWVRSEARLDDENFETLERLRGEGKVRTFGYSTHLRTLATTSLERRPWPVVMLRHSAAHPTAEQEFLPAARRHGTGVLAFTATCYGRLMQRVEGTAPEVQLPTAQECYRYALSSAGISATLCGPRSYRELMENLAVLDDPTLGAQRRAVLTEHGLRVRAHSMRFNALVRQAAPLPHPVP